MIIVKLQGGLGNQMFQYAAARSLSKSKKVDLDFSFLLQNNVTNDSFSARQFELGIFHKLKARIISNYFIKLLKSKKKLFKILSNRYYEVNDENILNHSNINSSNLYLDGYFQNPLIFQNFRDTLIDEFTFPQLTSQSKKIELKITAVKNPVAVHIRRGDYVKPEILNYHGLLSTTYYKQSVELINSKIENPVFFIFSDDTEWCKNNLSFIDKKQIITGTTHSWEDLYLMSKCKHQIIANSTFSWWGAWLNLNPEKIVIAPKRWLSYVETNIIPKEWISL